MVLFTRRAAESSFSIGSTDHSSHHFQLRNVMSRVTPDRAVVLAELGKMWADKNEVLLGTLSDEPTIEELSSVSVKAPADRFFYLFYLFLSSIWIRARSLKKNGLLKNCLKFACLLKKWNFDGRSNIFGQEHKVPDYFQWFPETIQEVLRRRDTFLGPLIGD